LTLIFALGPPPFGLLHNPHPAGSLCYMARHSPRSFPSLPGSTQTGAKSTTISQR